MRKNSLPFALALFFQFASIISCLSNNTITFETTSQQYGVADIDYFEITADTSASGRLYEAEYPSFSSTGFQITRGSASNILVWGQFGLDDGEVEYCNIAGSAQMFIRIRYSRKNPSNIPPPIQVLVNGVVETSWTPQETGEWSTFQITEWLPIDMVTPSGLVYYHPFQNFDDDVDRVKTFSNFFTGNSGIIGDTDLLTLSTDMNTTRTEKGRSLKIEYNNLDNFAAYVESFQREWFDFESGFNFKNLFPDFTGEAFENRQIDSIVFHCKLEADSVLTMKIEIADKDENKGEYYIEIAPTSEWMRIAIGIGDFITNEGSVPFNPTNAKYVGFTFSHDANDLPVNLDESGTFYLDDIFLAENEYEKPVFANDEDLLDYQNKVRFRFFWEAVDPSSYFIFDRHLWNSLISVDGIGWQLSSYTIAHRNQWIEPDVIEDRAEQILYNLLYKCEHTTEIDSAMTYPLRYASVKGNWAHFLDSTTLTRKDVNTEYSLFTNALLLSGVIVVREYFQDNPSIVSKADSIIALTDWNFLYNSADNLMHFHWTPENGRSTHNTDWFSEELDLVFLLGISSPVEEHALPNNPYFSDGYRRPLSNDEVPYIFSAPGAGFTYWFLQMYAPFSENTQRFQNARNAILKDKNLDNNLLGNFDLQYSDKIFGITACEGPDPTGLIVIGTDTINISNYHAYGYCNKYDTNNDPNGTIAVYGGLATLPFTPIQGIDLAKYYYYDLDSIFKSDYDYSFWSPIFGFPDAFHLDPDNSNDPLINTLNFNGPWLSVPRFAIDMGPMLINTDSYLTESGYYQGNSIRTLFSNYDPVAENLHFFDTIEVNNMPEVIQIDTSFQNEVFFADVTNAGAFSYEYYWMVNGELEQITIDSFISNNTLVANPGDTVNCILTVSLDSCNYSLFTVSNDINLPIVDNIEQLTFIDEITLAPNPVRNHLKLNATFYKKEDITLELHSSLGQLLFSKEYHEKLINSSIDLSKYPNGTYLLSLKTVSNVKSYLIVKN